MALSPRQEDQGMARTSMRTGQQRVCSAATWLLLQIVGGLTAHPGWARAQAQQRATSAGPLRRLTIVVLGTGVTAPDARATGAAFGVRLQHQVDSAHLPYAVTNVGRYAESSTDALRRLDSLVVRSMDVFLLETGSGDAARGLDADSTRTNVRAILHRVRAAHPESWVCLVRESPPSALPASDTAAFRALYGGVARSERAIILPGAADSLWTHLEPILRKVASLRLGGAS
jgi:hypothetical protein